jgi:Mg/Co/Ni transporter MgtE
MAEIMEKIGKVIQDIELLFFTDAAQRLLGVVPLSKLLVATPQTAIVN